MKKLLLLIVLATTCFAAQAQKNQVVFCISFTPEEYGYSGSSYHGGNTLSDLYEPDVWSEMPGGVGIDYLRGLNSRLWVGGYVFYGEQNITRTPGAAYKEEPQTYTKHFVSLMPSVRFDYIKGKILCDLYARVDAGVGLRTGTPEGTNVCFDYQLIPLGIKFGKKGFALIYEVGFGSLFNIRCGMGYTF